VEKRGKGVGTSGGDKGVVKFSGGGEGGKAAPRGKKAKPTPKYLTYQLPPLVCMCVYVCLFVCVCVRVCMCARDYAGMVVSMCVGGGD